MEIMKSEFWFRNATAVLCRGTKRDWSTEATQQSDDLRLDPVFAGHSVLHVQDVTSPYPNFLMDGLTFAI